MQNAENSVSEVLDLTFSVEGGGGGHASSPFPLFVSSIYDKSLATALLLGWL